MLAGVAVLLLLTGSALYALGGWPKARDVFGPPSCSAGSIALTFDDGPDVHTSEVLALLARHDVKATFFVLGEKAADRPELIRQATAQGHQVANHSWDHPHLVQLPPNQVAAELSSTTAAIMAAGAPPPVLVRPPYGEVNPIVLRAVASQHLKSVRWTIDTHDWQGFSSAQITASVLDHLQPDAVVLMHDGLRETPNTLQALPEIIDRARAAGYCFGFPVGSEPSDVSSSGASPSPPTSRN